MKLLVFTIFISVSLGAPQYYPQNYQQPYVPITSQTNEINPDGSYRYSYTTGDGQAAEQAGYMKNLGTMNEAVNVQGSYSYNSPEGIPIRVSYVADENGFRPEGIHIPSLRNQFSNQQSPFIRPTYRPFGQPVRPYGQY